MMTCDPEVEGEEWERHEREKDRDLERDKLEMDRAKIEVEVRGQELKKVFDVSKGLALVPKFDQNQVDSYFEAFEKKATQLKWPNEHWVTMMTTNLTGKAQETYVGMRKEDGDDDYGRVKAAILKAYDRVPEAYRLQFRETKPSTDQT